MFCQVISRLSGWFRLRQVMTVMSGYFRICQFSLGLVRLCQVSPG
jgi:hypothetical protein